MDEETFFNDSKNDVNTAVVQCYLDDRGNLCWLMRK